MLQIPIESEDLFRRISAASSVEVVRIHLTNPTHAPLFFYSKTLVMTTSMAWHDSIPLRLWCRAGWAQLPFLEPHHQTRPVVENQ